MAAAPARGVGIRHGARGYYAPVGPHPTVACPDCGQPADKDFGDHGGQCIADTKIPPPRSGLAIIRRHALHNRRFSSNDLRAQFDDANVPGPSRGPAFATAERRGWIERDGYERSTDAGTKGHPVAVYESLIYQPATAAAAARAERTNA